MTFGKDNDTDRPYGDPQRAARMRWEGPIGKTLRVTRESIGALFRAVAWPIKKLGVGLMRLGGGTTDLGYEVYNQGRDLYHWRRDD